MPSVLLIVDVFHPDPGVTARHYTEFAQSLQDRGWDVSVLSTDRSHRNPADRYGAEETWNGIRIQRTARLGLNIDRPLHRLLVAGVTLSRWVRQASKMRSVDVAVIGSNPPFAAALGPVLRKRWPGTKLVHWCFDVYPDAIQAEGFSPLFNPLLEQVGRRMRASYDAFDLIVDLGPRMRKRLAARRAVVRRATLAPWAFVEPDDVVSAKPGPRRELFGDAKLGVLYSGTLGRAHSVDNLLGLARACRTAGADVGFAFSCRDGRRSTLGKALTAEDRNIRLVDFAPEAGLEDRLNSADLHMMSLKAAWSGISVPSKFFGSLAVGRPVLYDGPADSDIARLILEKDVGTLLSKESIDRVSKRLVDLSADGAALRTWQARAYETYQSEFRRDLIMDRWDGELRSLLLASRGTGEGSILEGQ